jgi:mannose-6-phosphate isomerase class I
MHKRVGEPHARTAPGVYDLFPYFPLPDGQIQAGYPALAALIAEQVRAGVRRIAIDGFGGVLWATLQREVDAELVKLDVSAAWRDAATCFLPEAMLNEHFAKNLGGDDPLFGRLCEDDLSAFFDANQLHTLATADNQPVIVYGVGAALVSDVVLLIYVDVPKDEIQKRLAEKTITNLGSSEASYKRSYFLDWPVLNKHKAVILPNIDWFVDCTDALRPTLMSGDSLRAGLTTLSQNCFRVRPWFAPGPWGGQWMKEHFTDLDQSVPNYAWSFELITPENGLVLTSGGEQLEFSFDLLMFQHYREVLGRAAERFGYNFPIRFDYLDTIEGGNLSVQVHPQTEYMRAQFGEPFTQDESYYITTCTPGAQVYLGFRNGVDPAAFRREVETSQQQGITIDIDYFVNRVDAAPHDLFLIPSGTIHGSGVNNLVLEISATPYIYTFKIYDWMRRDLNGNLRPLNIERAWQNLDFTRQEAYVASQLCPQPQTLREGDGWREVAVGTHDALFYAVHRYEFEQLMDVTTDGRCHIMNVVQGAAVIVEVANGYRAQFNYAETFVIPAAAGSYRLIAVGDQPCKVVVAFVK